VEAATSILKTRRGNGGKLERYGIKIILRSLEIKHALEMNSLDKHCETIMSHVRIKNPSGLGKSQTSLMLVLEPVIVDYVIKLSNIRTPLNQNGAIELATSMIAGLPLEEKVIEWKKAHSTYYKGMPLLGISWYHLFVKCNHDKLSWKKALIRDI
jgi:hypothetical protein